MCGNIFHFGYFGAQKFLNLGQIANAWHNEKALPATIMLAQQSLAQHDRVPRHDIGAHGQTVDRWGLNDRQITQARHRHLQCPWYGRSGEREHMHVGLERLQLLLVINAEALFFIHNDKPKAFEQERLCEHGMRPDHNIHGPIGKALTRLRGFCSGHKPRQPTQFQRQITETFGKIRIMLPRQQGRWRNDSDLKPRHCRRKSGAHRNFGFTKANISAHQSVHRLASRQVLKHFFNHAELIFGFLIREAINETRISRAINLNNGPRP